MWRHYSYYSQSQLNSYLGKNGSAVWFARCHYQHGLSVLQLLNHWFQSLKARQKSTDGEINNDNKKKNNVGSFFWVSYWFHIHGSPWMARVSWYRFPNSTRHPKDKTRKWQWQKFQRILRVIRWPSWVRPSFLFSSEWSSDHSPTCLGDDKIISQKRSNYGNEIMDLPVSIALIPGIDEKQNKNIEMTFFEKDWQSVRVFCFWMWVLETETWHQKTRVKQSPEVEIFITQNSTFTYVFVIMSGWYEVQTHTHISKSKKKKIQINSTQN